MKRAVKTTVKRFGRIDILVNNAAVVHFGADRRDPGRPVVSEMAGLVFYLAGPEAAFITGANLKIDGGFTV